LAQSRPSSHGADWMDVVMTMVAFEAINNCRVVITLTAGDHKGLATLEVKLVALNRDSADGEAVTLASASATCSATNRRRLEDALLVCLYHLDARLAEGEFAKTLSGS